MDSLFRLADRHPWAGLIVLAIALGVVILAVGWALDVFVGWSEREDAPR